MRRHVVDTDGTTWSLYEPAGQAGIDRRLRPGRCVVRAIGGGFACRFHAPSNWARLPDDRLLELIHEARH